MEKKIPQVSVGSVLWLVIFSDLALGQVRRKEALERTHFRFILPRRKKRRPEGNLVHPKTPGASRHSWDRGQP